MRARVDKSGIACELERARTRTDALLTPQPAEDLVQRVSPIMSPLVWDHYRVLRGGSWATGPLVARTTFRNWDYPQRRQIFAGIRCAHDA